MAKNNIQAPDGFQKRRDFLKYTAMGFGSFAFFTMLPSLLGKNNATIPNIPPKVKRVIYLFQSGGPSQLETFDYKPALAKWHGQEIPDSIRSTQRNSGMVASQSSFPLVKSIYDFKQYGQSGAWVSDILPYTAKMADDLCIVKSVYTEAINHEPAVFFF